MGRLSFAQYQQHERAARQSYTQVIGQAFDGSQSAEPADFSLDETRLLDYLDAPTSIVAEQYLQSVLELITPAEFDIAQTAIARALEFSESEYGIIGFAAGAALQTVHTLRLIRRAYGSRIPKVLELNPNSPLTALLLDPAESRYGAIETRGAYYLLQNRVWSHFLRDDLYESALLAPRAEAPSREKLKSLIHLPWWQAVNDKAAGSLRYECVVAHPGLFDVPENGVRYLLRLARAMLTRSTSGPQLLFFVDWQDVPETRRSAAVSLAGQMGFTLADESRGHLTFSPTGAKFEAAAAEAVSAMRIQRMNDLECQFIEFHQFVTIRTLILEQEDPALSERERFLRFIAGFAPGEA